MTEGPAPTSTTALIRDVALYTVARLALVAALATVIIFGAKLFDVDVPLLVAGMFAIVIAMPLSTFVFPSLRKRVVADIVEVDKQRSRDKAELRARLRGDSTGKA